MQAVILAGGSGTRLRPLTYTVPKPMLPVAGKPVLAHMAEALAAAGYSEVLVTTNYLADAVSEGLRRLELPIPVRCIEEDTPLGTAGCVKNIVDRLDDEFLIMQGDAVADIDYPAFLEFHRSRGADVTLGVMRVQDPRDFGIVETDASGRIKRFQEKPRLEEAFSNLANSGCYMMRRAVFDQVPLGEPYDFSKQLFPLLMEQGARLFAWEMTGYWVDIGRVQTYLEGNRHRLQRVATVASDAVLAETAKLVPPFQIGSGCRIAAGCVVGPGTVLGQGCIVGANSSLSGAVVWDNVVIGSGVRLTDCVVASNTRLGDGVTVEPMAIVGADCEVGANAQLSAHCRVGPVTPVAPGTVVDGVVSPSMQKIEGFQRMMSHAPAMEQLNPVGQDIFSLLMEFGEMTARELADMAELPLLRLRTVLNELEAAGLVLATLDVPKRYALTREVPRATKRILFVDDQSDIRDFYRLAFTMQGHTVKIAADGREALEAVIGENFDAIIMDVEMPVMGGWDAVRAIRNEPNGASVPIVMFTSVDDAENRRLTHEVGATSLLAKPALPQQLISHVTQFLKR